MTINYTLYLETSATAKDATEAIRPVTENPKVDTSSEKLPPGESWLPDGPISISAWTLNRLPSIAQDNGVAAKLAVDFQLIVEEVVEAKPLMLRDLLALLKKIPGDSVFSDVADQVVLRRLNNKLELNLSCTFWTPELRALVREPHEARRL